jgi:hypothetical protein
VTVRRLLALPIALAIPLLAASCSSPTLEEACAEYCDAVAAAGCPEFDGKACSSQCDDLREQLGDQCVEEYTDTLDCAAGEDFECQNGYPVATSGGCTEEALDLLECAGFTDDDETSASE